MNEGNACMDCHDLKVGYGEPDTSYLGASKRNITQVKAAWAVAGNNTNALAVPDEFGCLYCHNSPVLKDDPDVGGILYENKMRDASNHFRGKASAHPVGYDLTTTTDKSGHLLSTFDCYNGVVKRDPLCADDFTTADGFGDRAKELDCTDCHDVTQSTGFLGYPQHGKPLATNPLMLRAGVGGFNLASAEYDDMCRRCHGSATGAGATGMAAFKSTGKNLRLASHQDASDVANNAMKEYDGTLLKVADLNNDGVADASTLSSQKKQCSTCHATHYSATNKKLFAVGMDISNGSKCTDCHFPGDNNNLGVGGNFVKYGHGKAGINFGCSSCHSVNADHDPTFPGNGNKMFGFTPDTTPSKYGKDLTSICKTCHQASQYTAHTGGTSDVGCIDCHDEHAEGVGSTSNRFMIPQVLPNIYPRTVGVNAEKSFFQSNGLPGSVEPGVYDFFVDNANVRKQADMPGENNASVCDNSICHTGVVVTGTPISPLATFMAASKHTGADRVVGSNCKACHSHTDSGGSWAANNSCTTCHGQPPVSTATSASGYIFYASNTDESKTPHKRHSVDYGYGCQECHNQWTTNALTHDTDPVDTFESIFFDTTRNPDAAVYPSALGYTVATNTCNNLYCHSDGQRHQVAGSVGTAVWMTGQQTPDWSAQDLGCNSCHGTTNATVGSVTYGAPDHANPGPTANSHLKHPYACAVCHNSTTQDTDPTGGWTMDLAGKKHVNGTIELLNGGGYTFTPGAAGTHVCNNISCHGGNSATWGGASLSCDQCHFRTTAGGGDQNNFALSDSTPSLINSEEWTTAGHGRTTNYPSGNVAAGFISTLPSDLKGCLYCHDGAVPHATGTNPFRLRNNNALGQGLTAANAFGWNDACLVCHSSLDGDGFDPDAAGGQYLPENAVKNIGQNHYGSKHSAGTQGGTFCWDCHDPHGDAAVPQYMLQGTNGGSPGNGVTQTSDGTYGIPTTSRAVTGFDSAAGGGTPLNFNSSDFVNAAFTGLCQTCHTTALYFNQTTNFALASHNGADTTRCTGCHQHTNDFGSACDTCHGNPPLPRPTTGTTQTWASDNAAGSQGDHTAHAATYLITDCNNTCHVNTTHATNKQTASMGTRAATAAASTGVHKYSTIDNVDVWTGNTVGITSVVDDSCANVNCHNSTYSGNAYKSAANPTYIRYWNNTFDCYSCHAYDGQADSAIRPGVQTAVAADWIATGSHDQHINRGGYAIACTNCHDTTGFTSARAGIHGNGSVNFVTNYGATRAGAIATGGVYDTNGATGGWTQVAPFMPTAPAHAYYCGNVYCHSSGDPRGAATPTYPATTQWTVTASGNCGTCHTITGSALVTNVHQKHTGLAASSQYNYGCQTCHYTVTTNGTTIAAGGFPLHVNGANNAAFALNEGTYTLAAGTCTATYCHSQGLDWSFPITTESSNLPPITADWDNPAALGCTGCHGNPPSYANDTSVTPGLAARLKKNSHAKHTAFGCQYCHNGTTTNGTTIVATTGVALHGNKAWNLAAGGGESFIVTTQGNMTGDAYVPTACGTITCHGNGSATWGATLACSACHDGNGATVAENAGVLGDGNTTANEVDQAQFTSTGHGRTTAYVSETGGGANNAGANLSCNSSDANNPVGGCHQAAAAHVPASGTDPWRLTGGGTNFSNTTTATNGVNGLCLYCHPASGINTHDSDITGGGTNALLHDTKCIDCHDPHGDTNIFMMQGRVAADSSGTDGVASDAYGMPETTVAASFTAWNPTGNTSDLDLLAGTNQLCEVCHTGTPTTGHSGGSGAPGHAVSYQGQNCIACHSHVSGFKGGGCDGCHGNGAGSNTPDSTPADLYEDRAGAHAAHVTAIGNAVPAAAGNNSCAYCHPGNPPAGHYGDASTGASQAEIIRMSTDGTYVGPPTAGDFWRYSGSSAATTGTAVYFKTLAGVDDTDAFYNATAKTCQNVNCHGGSATPNWLTGVFADAVGPVFSPDNTITVTDTGTSQDLQISWNVATDALSEPVSYDLYRINNATTGDACVTGVVIASNLGATAYFDSGLTNGTNYRYCVKAKDGVTPTPNGTNSTSAHAAPTAPAPGAKTYFLTRRNTGAIYGATNFNGGTCGTAGTAAAATTTPATIPYVVRGGLEETLFCGTASATNYISNSSPNAGAGTAFENMLAFYTPTTYANTTVVTGAATGTSIWTDSSSGTEDIRVWLAASNPTTGALTPMSAAFNWANIGTALVAKTGNLSGMTVTVPAGSRLAFLVTWADANTTVSTSDRIHVDNMTTGISQIAVTEVATDAVAPAFAANNSGITATDAASGGTINVAWNAATDAFPSNPVRYTVYGVQSAAAPSSATLFQAGNIKQNNILGTSVTVTGLAVGNPWWFGVRSTDAANNVETANVTISTPGVVPTDGGGGVTCTSCHGTAPTTPAHSKHANTDAVYTDCDKCHGNAANSVSANYTTSGPAGLHNNGSVDMYFLRISGETNAVFNNLASPNDTCTNVNCHSNSVTPSWSTGSGNCSMCHGYPPSTGTNHLLANREGAKNSTDAAFYAAHGVCDTCHGISGNQTPPTVATAMGTPVSKAGGDTYDPALHHANGSVTMNGTLSPGDGLSAEYVEATNGCNKSCHTAAEKFTTVQANPVHLLRLGGGECTGCHKVGGSGSVVTVDSPHSTTITGRTCEYCHTAHGSGTVNIPNYPNVGINYTANGETGIALGNSAGATGATEADICWTCHAAVGGTATVLDATDPSEWGLNTDTNGTAANYNFGTLTGTASWFTGTWTSANFSYKTGKLVDKPTSTGVAANGGSTHTANPSGGVYGGPTVRGVDTAAQVRCSYCHDVHDTRVGSPSGKPYLRGTWKGNPYLEDGAPRSGVAFNSGSYGAVPRGTVTATGSGGYQIDQNNGSPTIAAPAWTLADSAGLCGLCHGSTAPGALTAGAVDTLNHFATTGWIGTNGHSASVLGGGNVNAFNLLSESTRRHTVTAYPTGSTGGDGAFRTAPWMAYKQLATGSQGWGFRGEAGDGAGLAPIQRQPYGQESYAWGATVENAGTAQVDYHKFSCSKCHTPHASRLPALMITNCLDTKNNTWDDTMGSVVTGSAENVGTRPSNWTSAQNCHRRRDPAFNKNWTGNPGTVPGAQTDGWNSVTPW